MRTLWRARNARDAGAVRTPRRPAGRAALRTGGPARASPRSRPTPRRPTPSRAGSSCRSAAGPSTWSGSSTTATGSSCICPRRVGSTSRSRPRRRSPVARWPASSSPPRRRRLDVERRRAGAGARDAAQGVVVGAGAGRRGSPGRARSRSGQRGVRRIHPHQRLRRHLRPTCATSTWSSGIGRGWGDDILHRAKLSPFASLRSLTPDAARGAC